MAVYFLFSAEVLSLKISCHRGNRVLREKSKRYEHSTSSFMVTKENCFSRNSLLLAIFSVADYKKLEGNAK